VPQAAFRLTGSPSTYQRQADSGNTVVRAFCGACGSAVYSTNSGTAGAVFVRASSLDDPERFVSGNDRLRLAGAVVGAPRSQAGELSEMPPASQQPAKLQ
jgi:hypothetical protein